MALSLGCLVTSIISPRAGKGDPDCSKTKLTFRPHRREYFPAFYASRCARMIHSWIPEGVAWRWVLSLKNLGLPSLHAPSSAPFWTVQLVILTVTSRHFSSLTYKFYGAWWPRVHSTRFCSNMKKRDISSNLCQKYLIACSTILLNVLFNRSLTLLLPWQHTRFQTSPY